MALSFKFKPIDAITRVHEIAAKALSDINGAPALKIVNHRIHPSDENGTERTGFEALLNTSGPRPTLHISPPSKLARELGDWSSPEALDSAAKAALWCCEAYGKALADSGLLSAEAIKEAKSSLRTSLASAFDAARQSLSPPEAPFISQSSWEAFKAMRERIDNPADLAQMAAARHALSQLPPGEAKALMIQSDLVFAVSPTAPPAPPEPAAQSEPTSALPSFKKKQQTRESAYNLFQNGSFHSRLHSSSDNPAELAAAIVSPDFSLGMEHMVHRHFLQTPDGEIHGAESIERWARDTLRHVEAIELARHANAAPKSSRPSL